MSKSQPTEWRPIETAPQDDTPVLLWNGDVNVGESSGGEWYTRANGQYVWEGDGDRGGLSTVDRPTHWMPLPKPPGTSA